MNQRKKIQFFNCFHGGYGCFGLFMFLSTNKHIPQRESAALLDNECVNADLHPVCFSVSVSVKLVNK